ncbi:LOW QUALITY PROTEIN: lipase 3-like [Drosophila ficusphila]|uniref:LOW QUALITY PROTEIN: lipase 3-like n=1 Tax=Drosophila ficusphila TaxID=30025 RepID=UPI001C8AB935|nr:LOW QUALITY PROTEIN: lipase 3-like [Drosophila ficusphila]
MRLVFYTALFALLALHQVVPSSAVEEQSQDQSLSSLKSENPQAQSQVQEQGSGQSQAQSQSQLQPRTCGSCQTDRLVFLSQDDIVSDSKLDTPGLIQKYGYPVETHFAITDDGYKLGIHRIPRPGATAVLLVHGLMCSSASWVQFGPSSGLAYILYRKGFDVWMLNTRGNIYSAFRDHVQKSEKEFWDFSFHEVGKFDIPAAIDLVVLKTGQPSIQVIGHSQGSTAFFAMSSEKPEYALKVKLMQCLSPTVLLRRAISPVLKFIKFFNGGLGTMISMLGGYKVALANKLIPMFKSVICSHSRITNRICAIFEFMTCGFNWRGFNETLSPILEGHASQGGSAKQILHLAQLVGRKSFTRYDFGGILNRMRYKTLIPPAYNLSQAISKVALHYGASDWLSSDEDVKNLEASLPNVIESRKVAAERFSHFDFTISKDAQTLVYDRVVEICASNR